MKELNIANELLKSIIYGDETFAHGMKNIFSTDKSNISIRPIVASLVGCSLRHYYLFETLLKDSPLSSFEKCLVYVCLSNNLFVKRLDANLVNNFAKNELENKYEDVKSLLEFEGTPFELIPNDLNKLSLEFLSIRYNSPSWIIKMWQKHYSIGDSFKILKANTKASSFSLRILPTTTKEDIKDKDNLFIDTMFDDVLLYEGRLPNKRNDFAKSFNTFPIKLAMKDLLNKVKNYSYSDALLYLEEDISPAKELLLTNNVKFNLAIPDFKDKMELKHLINDNSYSNTNLFDAPNPMEMNAAISNKVDLAIVYPTSSSFDKIRLYPDYLVKFNKENIDSLIAHELEALLGCSTHLRDNGVLVYAVLTLNKKESHNVVAKFINEHKEFVLLEEHQYMPFDEFDTALYYAVIKKEAKKEKQND